MNTVRLGRDDARALFLSNDINSRTIVEFEAKVSALLEEGCRFIIIEFTNVCYITSEAIGVLIGAQRVLRNRNGGVLLSNVTEYIRWVLTSCGGGNVFPFYENIEKAVLALPS